ncbi:hypothetical protein AHIS1_p059 [Acaryochloris phage A-HIS1]|nr:hypothetical protein AHIS1_p059 [Acaryochloris phage A-HIS1]
MRITPTTDASVEITRADGEIYVCEAKKSVRMYPTNIYRLNSPHVGESGSLYVEDDGDFILEYRPHFSDRWKQAVDQPKPGELRDLCQNIYYRIVPRTENVKLDVPYFLENSENPEAAIVTILMQIVRYNMDRNSVLPWIAPEHAEINARLSNVVSYIVQKFTK